VDGEEGGSRRREITTVFGGLRFKKKEGKKMSFGGEGQEVIVPS